MKPVTIAMDKAISGGTQNPRLRAHPHSALFSRSDVNDAEDNGLCDCVGLVRYVELSVRALD
jgi:hypothetical protein